MSNIPFPVLVLAIPAVLILIGSWFKRSHSVFEPFKSAEAKGVKLNPAWGWSFFLLMIGGFCFVVVPSFGSLEFIAERVDLGTATAWGHLLVVSAGINICLGAVAAIGYQVYKAVRSGSFRFAFKPFFQKWGAWPGFFMGAVALSYLSWGTPEIALPFFVLVGVSGYILLCFFYETVTRAALSEATSQKEGGV